MQWEIATLFLVHTKRSWLTLCIMWYPGEPLGTKFLSC